MSSILRDRSEIEVADPSVKRADDKKHRKRDHADHDMRRHPTENKEQNGRSSRRHKAEKHHDKHSLALLDGLALVIPMHHGKLQIHEKSENASEHGVQKRNEKHPEQIERTRTDGDRNDHRRDQHTRHGKRKPEK